MRRTLLGVLALLPLASVAPAQQTVFRATSVLTSSYGPGGVGGAWNGQPDFTQWTAWPERGSQITLTQASVVTEMTVFYLQTGPLTGAERVVVRVYANDGANANGDATATPYPSPGTLLWTSTPQTVLPGDRVLRLTVPSVAFPTNVTVTAQFSGGNLSVGPFDPNNASTRGGLRFHGTPQVGSLPSNAANSNSPGLVWRRVFTSSGASSWGCDEPAASWTPFNPSTGWGFGIVVNSGNLSSLPSPFDNQTSANVPQFFLDYPYTDGTSGSTYDGSGARVSVEGPNRQLTSVNLLMGADTLSNPGASFILRLWKPDNADTADNRGRPGTLLWTSPVQSIPDGLDPLTNPQFSTTVPIPNIIVPNEFCWTVEFSGLTGNAGSLAGPYVRWAPAPGNSSNGIYQRNTTSGVWEGPFVFLPTGWTNGGPTFQYEINAFLDARFTGTNPEVTAVPQSFSLVFGRQDAGNLGSLAAIDGDALRVCRFIVPNATVPPVRVQVDSTVVLGQLETLVFSLHSRMVHAGAFALELELFDFASGQYRDLASGALGSSYVTQSVVGGGNVNGFLGAGGALRARYSVRNTGPVAVSAWCHEADQAKWVAAP